MECCWEMEVCNVRGCESLFLVLWMCLWRLMVLYRLLFVVCEHSCLVFFFFQAEDGIRDGTVTGVQTCALPIWEACISHGALGAETIIMSAEGACLRDFRCASSSATEARLDGDLAATLAAMAVDRKSTRLNSSHSSISYAVFCLKKKKKKHTLYT